MDTGAKKKGEIGKYSAQKTLLPRSYLHVLDKYSIFLNKKTIGGTEFTGGTYGARVFLITIGYKQDPLTEQKELKSPEDYSKDDMKYTSSKRCSLAK